MTDRIPTEVQPIKFFDGHPAEERKSNWKNTGLDYDGRIVMEAPVRMGIVPTVNPPRPEQPAAVEPLPDLVFPVAAHVDIVSDDIHVGVGRLNPDGTIELISFFDFKNPPKVTAKT